VPAHLLDGPLDATVRVVFCVYGCSGLSLADLAERLRAVVPVPLTRRVGRWRGEYYRWSGDEGEDLLLQANVPDEAGVPVEPGAPAHEPLVYATNLPAHVGAALARVDALRLLSADVASVPVG
jgi:hypothetical protein